MPQRGGGPLILKLACQMLYNLNEIHFLELEKVKKLGRMPKNALEAWLMYLNNLPGEKLEAMPVEVPGLKKALTIEEIFKKSEKERRLYELREKAIRDEISMVAGAEERGMAKGRIEGRIEGLVEKARDSINRLLQKRFASVASELQNNIDQITDLETLDRIYDRLLDAETPEQARQAVLS